MSLKPYPKYKDSGVAWLGEVPEGWGVTKTVRLFKVAMGQTILKEDLVDGGEWPVFSATDGDHYFGYVNNPQVQLHEGDLVIPARGNSIGAVKAVKEPSTTTQTTIYCKRRAQNKLFQKFVYYYMVGCKENLFYFTQTAIPQITTQEVGANPLLVPSSNDQIAICNFLDAETTKIDELIAEQEKLIALLAEKRQATISHAVTKGLNPDALMKDSGIEWLGQIPAHWEIKRLKYLGDAIIGLTYNPSDVCNEGEGVLVLRSSNIQSSKLSFEDNVYVKLDVPEKLIVREGDILICSRNGSRSLIGKNAVISAEVDGQTFGAFMTIFRSEINSYLAWVFNSNVFAFQSATFLTATINQLTTGNLYSFEVPLPSNNEQKQIVEYLNALIADFDKMINEANRVIELLKERRTALISAVVTGKIDVREMAKVIPFPIDRRRLRGLVATEIIENLSQRPTFGRVMLQKAAYLAETFANISELDGHYLREAAGPLDRNMIDEMESEAGNLAGISISQIGGVGTAVKYRTTGHIGKYKNELKEVLGQDRAAKLRRIISIFTKLDTAAAEAYATIFAVWNDFLIDGLTPSDDEIINGILNDWHPEKGIKFKFSELKMHLGKMRELGLVPTGLGKKTETGRLFT